MWREDVDSRKSLETLPRSLSTATETFLEDLVILCSGNVNCRSFKHGFLYEEGRQIKELRVQARVRSNHGWYDLCRWEVPDRIPTQQRIFQ